MHYRTFLVRNRTFFEVLINFLLYYIRILLIINCFVELAIAATENILQLQNDKSRQSRTVIVIYNLDVIIVKKELTTKNNSLSLHIAIIFILKF